MSHRIQVIEFEADEQGPLIVGKARRENDLVYFQTAQYTRQKMAAGKFIIVEDEEILGVSDRFFADKPTYLTSTR